MHRLVVRLGNHPPQLVDLSTGQGCRIAVEHAHNALLEVFSGAEGLEVEDRGCARGRVSGSHDHQPTDSSGAGGQQVLDNRPGPSAPDG